MKEYREGDILDKEDDELVEIENIDDADAGLTEIKRTPKE